MAKDKVEPQRIAAAAEPVGRGQNLLKMASAGAEPSSVSTMTMGAEQILTSVSFGGDRRQCPMAQDQRPPPKRLLLFESLFVIPEFPG